jgi:outer membrane receptor for ferrienterochelin and colicin
MRICLITFFFLIYSQAFGQLHQNLTEVLVEADAEKTAVKQQKEAGESKLVVSSKDLNNFGHHAAGDVLKRLPMVVMQGPPSFNRNIMMAGLDKKFQAILIDGERPAGGEDDRDLKLDRIPMDMIQSIEIIYNPSAAMGADATIGALNVVLKDAPDTKVIAADISFDNTSTKPGINPEFALTLGNKWGKWSALGVYSLNNFKRMNVNNITDGEMFGTENEELNVWIHGFTGTLAYKPDSTKTWKYRTFFSRYFETLDFLADIKRRTQGGLNTTADTANDDKLRILHSQTLSYLLKKQKYTWETKLEFAQHFDSKDRWRWRSTSDGTEESFEDEYQVNSELIGKSEYKRKIALGKVKHTLCTGARFSALDRVYDRMVYTKIVGRLFWDQIEDGSYTLNEYRIGAFVSDEISVGNWWFLPALRYDYDWGSYTTPAIDGAVQYASLNPSLHAKYKLTKDLFLKVDMARQISRPPFNLMVPVDKVKNKKELIERGNPDLEPSRAWNFGIGAEKYMGDKSFVAFRGFYSQLRNVIETREIGIDENYGYRIFKSVNVDSGLVWGMDINTRIDLEMFKLSGFAFNGNVSWMGSEVRDPGTLKLRRLNEQPKWTMNTSIDYLNTRQKFQISAGLNYIGERLTSATISEGTPVDALVQQAFWQMDVRLKYFFTSWGSIYLNGINIFDQTIELKQGAVSESEIIGRNMVFGLSLRF